MGLSKSTCTCKFKVIGVDEAGEIDEVNEVDKAQEVDQVDEINEVNS